MIGSWSQQEADEFNRTGALRVGRCVRLGMRVMLDSDAYSILIRGNSRGGDIVRSAEQIVIPAVVVGELLYAFR